MLEQRRIICYYKGKKVFEAMAGEALHRQHRCICTVEYAKWVYRRIFAERKKLVGADDQLRQELVGQAVEVSPVELGFWPSLEVGF
jgi:hypothetical protein